MNSPVHRFPTAHNADADAGAHGYVAQVLDGIFLIELDAAVFSVAVFVSRFDGCHLSSHGREFGESRRVDVRVESGRVTI